MMTNMKQSLWMNWTIGAVLAGGLVFAGSASAHDRNSRHSHDHHVRKAKVVRYDVSRDRGQVRQARQDNRRLDRQGAIIDLQLDGLAVLASAYGEYELAHVLDRAGDHIQYRLDRKGDRRLRQARRDVRVRNHSRHVTHVKKVDRRPSRHQKVKHQVRNDRKRSHVDWLGDRAQDSNRDRRNRNGDRRNN